MSDLVTVHIDGRSFEVESGRNMLDVALSLGFDLPYFCWHPAMGSVGACRQCAVMQTWTNRRGEEQNEIVMACMTAAEGGTTISIDHPEARAYRRKMIELLMTNHPHDCPVCDEGGECHLQDMTVMTGHNYRTFRHRKRTYENQDLGPFVTHEMNRCIACYRCVRFYRDYAGGTDFGVFSIRNQVYFGRQKDGVLESEFSGNLVEVCPTGVFDDKTLARHYSRKWDLQTAPSVCPHCGMGCSITPHERYGELRRVLARYNPRVNGHFICDRGRFGYAFVNATQRYRVPVVRDGDGRREVGWTPGGTPPAQRVPPPALGPSDDPGPANGGAPWSRRGADPYVSGAEIQALVDGLAARLATGTTIGIGSPRASLESNFAVRTLVGAEHFYLGLSESERDLADLALALFRDGARPAELADLEAADAVLVIGEDLADTSAILELDTRIWSRLRPTAEEERLSIARWNDSGIGRLKEVEPSALWVLHTHATKLDPLAAGALHAAPATLARVALALARRADPSLPEVKGLGEDLTDTVSAIGALLDRAKLPVIITGTGTGSSDVLRAAAMLARALPGAESGPGAGAPLFIAQPEPNTMGLALMGGGRLAEALRRVQTGEADNVLVLENDLVRRAGAAAAELFLARAPHLVAIDHVPNGTTEEADVVLPAATWAESTGTLVSAQGLAQRFYAVFRPGDGVRAGWEWVRDLLVPSGRSEGARWAGLRQLQEHLAEELPQLAGILEAAPSLDLGVPGEKLARKPARYSGRTAMTAHLTVHEPKPPEDPDTPFVFSQEGYLGGEVPVALAPQLWAPGWNSQNSLHRFQEELEGPQRGGDRGAQLLPPAPVAGSPAAAAPAPLPPPEPFAPREGELLAVPVQHLFGSGELSMWSEGIAQRAPEPYVALSPGDAERLDAGEGDLVDVPFPDLMRRLPVRIDKSLPAGVAGVPSGLRGLPGVALPAWIAPRFAARGTAVPDPFAGPLPPPRDAGDSSYPPSDQDAPGA